MPINIASESGRFVRKFHTPPASGSGFTSHTLFNAA
jgi:hypothetical protein